MARTKSTSKSIDIQPRSPRKATTTRGCAKKTVLATSTATLPAPTRNTSEEPSASELLNHSQQTTDEWYKSVRTKKGYANYVKSGKKWLEDWIADGRLEDTDETGEDGTNGEAQTVERSNFKGAFDKITSETAVALRLLTAYKCDHLGRGFATAEGLRSAFKHYFER